MPISRDCPNLLIPTPNPFIINGTFRHPKGWEYL